jgi:hypothetical protein
LRIAEIYSHLNGLEYLEARKGSLWAEIEKLIDDVDVASCRTKVSKEARMQGKVVYSPKALNSAFKAGFSNCSPPWLPETTNYWVCSDPRVNRRIIEMEPKDQKKTIEAAGLEPIRSKNQTDFVKERVAVEVQFGKYAFVAYDLFVKHMAFYVIDKIDVGVEILPMKCLQAEMSSGPCYYERELHNLVREGRGVPAVPLVLVGVAP